MSSNPYEVTAPIAPGPQSSQNVQLRKRATWLSWVLGGLGMGLGGFIALAMAEPPQIDPSLAAAEAQAHLIGYAIGYAFFPALICGCLGWRFGRRRDA